jgi:hypothetical protein
MRRLFVTLATAVALTAALMAPGIPRALGDERAPRRVGINRKGPWLTTSVSLRDLFQPGDGERLRSGFVHRVVIRVELWPEGGKQPLYRADRHAELLYDLWEERFLLRIADRYGIQERGAGSERDAVELATALIGFEVAEFVHLRSQQLYRLRFTADLNPLDPDLVREVKRWLVRSPGAGRGGAGESVFGSVVNIFVNPQIEDSERQISFWSQPFQVAPPP